MEILTKRKYKVDLNKINEIAVERAFGESRFKVNEEGLSEKALEAKKSVIAIQELGRLFVRHALAWLTDEKAKNGERVKSEDRHEIEHIGTAAIAAGGDCVDFLRQFCE